MLKMNFRGGENTELVSTDNLKSEEEDMKQQALEMCQKFLGGAWHRVTLDNMAFQRIHGGLSNILYLCSMPDNLLCTANEARRALVRIHCQIHDSRKKENQIFEELSKRSLGPQLYGVFNGGRVEEYVCSTTLQTDDLSDKDMCVSIAAMLANVHELELPGVQHPLWLTDVLNRWLTNARKKDPNSVNPKDIPLLKSLMELPLEEEVSFVEKLTAATKSPVVFCHNDLQEGNILRLHSRPVGSASSSNVELMFIDYEYCGYNYRGFDIANHLCEWAVCYKVDHHPFFTYQPENLPSEKQQRLFISAYLANLKEIHGETMKLKEEEKILQEVPVFYLASHLVWALWALFQVHISPIGFGHVEFAQARMDAYYLLKQTFM